MAETAVTLVIDKLQKLLVSEATILVGVHDEVNRINVLLQMISAFLKEADMKAEAEGSSNAVKTWVKQMREVAFRMEDVVDYYLLKVAERGHKHGLPEAITRGIQKVKSVKHRHDITYEIRGIRKSMDDLYKTMELLKFNPSESSTRAATPGHDGRLGAHFVEESHLVGVDHDVTHLINWLSRGQSKCSVMAVVGEGGIGKTAIVKNVYKKQKERKSFDCYAWITVSRLQDNDMTLKAIIHNIREEQPNASATLGVETMNPLSLISKIRECLKGKRYLIVFDDVWQSNFWDVVKDAILDGNTRSRVLITTRNKEVANYCISHAPVDVHELKPLSTSDALKLFCRKAFKQEGCPVVELKKLSEDFVMKCNGVPLAIETMAGLLSTKNKTAIEWHKVHTQLGSLLQSNPHLERVQQVMLESYYDLPSHLKPCLLYFALFPEDYSIRCMKLIRLWVAEGFVIEGEIEQKPMEEHAEEYLAELIGRCLVQVSQVDFNGKPKSCHVHDLMHDFIVTKCKEQNFCQVMNGNVAQPTGSVSRRLSINLKSNRIAAMTTTGKWKKVRSCFVFDDAKKWPLTRPFFSSFELLTGLDMCDARLDHLPEEVGQLLNLRYLSLRNTNIKLLPKSIGKLENLQTLDLKNTRVHELPDEIKNLIKLRHLLAYYVDNQHLGLDRLLGVKFKKGLGDLTSLQKLSFLDVADSASIIKELKQLSQLRKLGIIKLTRQYGQALCTAIENMNHLCSLSIGAMGSNEILELQSLTKPPKDLQRLYLYGRLESFPNWISELKCLTRLYLKWSGLKVDPLPHLKDLSNLLQLELYDTYEGEELHFEKGWLRGLKFMCIESMPNLKTIKIDEGALPHLEKLKIGKCHEMVQVPRDLQNLPCLKTLHVYGMSENFVKRIMGSHGEDRLWILGKIQNVLYANEDQFFDLQNLDSLNDG